MDTPSYLELCFSDIIGVENWARGCNITVFTGWGKAWAWEAKDDMEAADREGLQRVEALSYQPSW